MYCKYFSFKELSIVVTFFFVSFFQAYAVEEKKPDDFVIASIIIAEPDDVLYSSVGHCAIHMQCPEHNLDYVFSYEAEPVSHQVLRFLAGGLKMGMFAIPTEEYLNNFRKDGRGVREYTLNLPIETKQELWRVLDNHLIEGPNLPYDYVKRGCAHSSLMMILEALGETPIVYGPWPDKFKTKTRRELREMSSMDYPWARFFIDLISNGIVNASCSMQEKIVIPKDLVDILQNSTVNGRQLLSSDDVQLLPDNRTHKKYFITPLFLAVLLLLITLSTYFYQNCKPFCAFADYFLLALQTIIGAVTVYLVCFSTMVGTEWSWLIIPFNPLPLFLWKLRKYWCKPYAVIIAIWTVSLIVYKHQLTSWPYLVLAMALVVDYLRPNFKK